MNAAKRRVVFAVLCASLATVLASALALQGKRYFFCDMMGVVLDDPCVTGQRQVALETVNETDCCHVGHVPSVPPGATVAAQIVPPVGLVAVLPPAAVLPPPASLDARTAARATGPPRAPNERVHARLMILLT